MKESFIHRKEEVPSLTSIIRNDVEYTADQCIEDLQRVSKTFTSRRITRDFYRIHGTIPESIWAALFGQFPEFLRQAGLNYSRYQNKVRNRAAQHASVDHLKELSEERKTYGNLYERDHGNRFKTMIAGSDFHDIECDPFFLRVFTDTIKTIQPDIVCLDGDVFDLPEFGKYSVDPRDWDVVGRVNAGLDICRQVREAAPDAQIDLIEGNHEARLLKHVKECSPAMQVLLSDLHGMDVRRLLKLDEHEINYHARGDLATFTVTQERRETLKNYKVYWNSVMAHHFPQGRDLGVPGFNGHHHKHLVWTMYNETYGSYEWHQLGSGHKRVASYCDGAKWNCGFVIVNVDMQTRKVNFDYVDVGTSFAVAGGTWFYRNPDEYYSELESELVKAS